MVENIVINIHKILYFISYFNNKLFINDFDISN